VQSQILSPETKAHDQTPSLKMSTKDTEKSAATSPPAKRHRTSSSSSSSSSSAPAPIFSTTRNINKVPVEVWKEHICQKFLNLTELSILRRCHTFFEKYWQNVMAQNVIRVPQGCSTVEKAMDLAVIFSERKEYTETEPLKIRVDEGVHEIVGTSTYIGKGGSHTFEKKMMDVTCSHITFVGKGKSRTTIRGGFCVKNQQHVKFEEMTLECPTLPCPGSGIGLDLHGTETNVDVLNCVFKECAYAGMDVGNGGTVTATRCDFMENGQFGVACSGANTKVRLNDSTMHHNGMFGLYACDHAVTDLHGTKTDIHSNKINGIYATRNAKVNIHLPSQHNTSHDNVGEDRHQEDGGSIANMNADGTFTHVIVPQEVVEDEDDY
jgi:hypothetical protein